MSSSEVLLYKPWEGLRVHAKLLARKSRATSDDLTPSRTQDTNLKGYASEVDLDTHPWPQTTNKDRVADIDGDSWKTGACHDTALFDMFGEGAVVFDRPKSTRPKDRQASKTGNCSRKKRKTNQSSDCKATTPNSQSSPCKSTSNNCGSDFSSESDDEETDNAIAAQFDRLSFINDDEYLPAGHSLAAPTGGISAARRTQRPKRNAPLAQKAKEGYPSSDDCSAAVK